MERNVAGEGGTFKRERVECAQADREDYRALEADTLKTGGRSRRAGPGARAERGWLL